MVDGWFECSSSSIAMTRKKTKGSGAKNKPRFSDEQIRSLEVMFESETKLDPKKKLQLAKELGLHPRQVAIWFQNKRARWKSKHIEKEYRVLLANYNNLPSQFESLRKEKESLVVQLEKLKSEMMGKCEGEKNQSRILDTGGGGRGGGGNYYSSSEGDESWEVKQVPRECLEGMFNSDDDIDSGIVKAEFLAHLQSEEENDQLLNMDLDSSSLTSSSAAADHWNSSLDSDDHWWDFWS